MRKTFLLLIPLLLLALLSCEKDNRSALGYYQSRISDVYFMNFAGVSDILHFTYNTNGLVESIESPGKDISQQRLIYDSRSKLIGSEYIGIEDHLDYWTPDNDTTNNYLKQNVTRCSYILDNSGIFTVMIDSVYKRYYVDGIMHTESNTFNNLSIAASKYYYSAGKLDSIRTFSSLYGNWLRFKTEFKHRNDGNMTSLTEHFYPLGVPSPGLPYLYYHYQSETITEFIEYDNHPNPFYLLFKQYGTILYKLEEQYITKNNPLKCRIKSKTNDDWTESEIEYSYKYNAIGYPTEITRTIGDYSEVILKIDYLEMPENQ